LFVLQFFFLIEYQQNDLYLHTYLICFVISDSIFNIASEFNLSLDIVYLRYVFIRRKVKNDRSAVQFEQGVHKNMCKAILTYR